MKNKLSWSIHKNKYNNLIYTLNCNIFFSYGIVYYSKEKYYDFGCLDDKKYKTLQDAQSAFISHYRSLLVSASFQQQIIELGYNRTHIINHGFWCALDISYPLSFKKGEDTFKQSTLHGSKLKIKYRSNMPSNEFIEQAKKIIKRQNNRFLKATEPSYAP